MGAMAVLRVDAFPTLRTARHVPKDCPLKMVIVTILTVLTIVI
jgi:hypothetical protein